MDYTVHFSILRLTFPHDKMALRISQMWGFFFVSPFSLHISLYVSIMRRSMENLGRVIFLLPTCLILFWRPRKNICDFFVSPLSLWASTIVMHRILGLSLPLSLSPHKDF